MTTQAELGLFDVSGFPVRKAADSEQRALPIDGTLQAEYDAWRRTELGTFVYDAVRCEAIRRVRAGDQKVGMKAIVEWARWTHRVECNNSLVSLLARELLDREPELRGAIELRQRSAA